MDGSKGMAARLSGRGAPLSKRPSVGKRPRSCQPTAAKLKAAFRCHPSPFAGETKQLRPNPIAQAQRSKVTPEDRAAARERVRHVGLCWRVRERRPAVIDDIFEERSRPLPSALEQMLPGALLAGERP